MKNKRIVLISLIAILIIIVSFIFVKEQYSEYKYEKQEAEKQKEMEEKEASTVSFTVTGDIIGHDTILQNAQTETGYDFKPYFSEVTEYLDSDVVYANFEHAASDDYEYMGYPAFNSPSELIDDLVELGFNTFSLASNHSLDFGTDAIKSTSDYFAENYPEVVVNGYNDSCDAFTYDEFTIKGIDFTFVSYTDIFNNPDAYSNCNINNYSAEEAEAQLKQAASTGDVNIITIHYGEENVSEVSSYDYEIEEKLLSYGYEIILGTHPHVLKPIHKTTNSQGNDALVAYSLGNCLSSQLEEAQRLGVFLTFDVWIDETGKVVIDNIKGNPTYMYYDWGDSGYIYQEGDDPSQELLLSRSNVKIVPLDELDQYTSQEHEEEMKAMYKQVVDASIIEE